MKHEPSLCYKCDCFEVKPSYTWFTCHMLKSWEGLTGLDNDYFDDVLAGKKKSCKRYIKLRDFKVNVP